MNKEFVKKAYNIVVYVIEIKFLYYLYFSLCTVKPV